MQVQKVQKGAEGSKGGGGDAIRYPLSAYRLLYGCIPERNDRGAGHQTSDFPAPLLYGPREALINLQNQISYAFLSNAAS